jgi:hypothetical protein
MADGMGARDWVMDGNPPRTPEEIEAQRKVNALRRKPVTARYVLEGEWTGYTAAQQRVVHREVITARRAERLMGLREIVYTDGTLLLVRVRPAEPYEKVTPILGYRELIRDAEAHGGARVYVSRLCEKSND